jgi:hypothetical protein
VCLCTRARKAVVKSKRLHLAGQETDEGAKKCMPNFCQELRWIAATLKTEKVTSTQHYDGSQRRRLSG